MTQQHAITARIKRLENKLLGLMHKTKNMRATPCFCNISNAFNHNTQKPALALSFAGASATYNSIKAQIVSIRSELSYLRQLSISAPELTMVA